MSWYENINPQGCMAEVVMEDGTRIKGRMGAEGKMSFGGIDYYPIIHINEHEWIRNHGVLAVTLIEKGGIESDYVEDDEWFKDLSDDDLEGKHVTVCSYSKNGSIRVCDRTLFQGRLNRGGCIDFPYDSKQKVLYRNSEDGILHKTPGVEYVDFVWDERSWRPIENTEVEPGDAVVLNGKLAIIKKVTVNEYGNRQWEIVADNMKNACLVRRSPSRYALRHITNRKETK